MDKADQGETNDQTESMYVCKWDRDAVKQALEHTCEGRFAGDSKAQAGQSNAKLHCCKQFIETGMEFLNGAGAYPAGLSELLDPGVADTDQGKLSGHEEGIGCHQENDQEHLQQRKGEHKSP